MKYSVFLQEPCGFRPLWTLLGAGMVLAAALLWALLRRLERADGRGRGTGRSKCGRLRLWLLKRRYLRRVDRVERALRAGKCGCREAHQQLSMELRLFVGKATGERTDTLVLSELEESDFRHRALGEVISGMYKPEFARLSEEDTAEAISESRKLIRTWT